jgi:acyl-CoA reductase-like NAD-dependent aldehyde dehydrogenase
MRSARPRSSLADLNDALDAAVSAKAKAAAAGYERAALLRRAGKLLVERRLGAEFGATNR